MSTDEIMKGCMTIVDNNIVKDTNGDIWRKEPDGSWTQFERGGLQGFDFDPVMVDEVGNVADELTVGLDDLVENLNSAFGNIFLTAAKPSLTPKRILQSGPATIVFWKNGDKTIVKCSDDDQNSEYAAFTAALAKKIFGSNSAVKKIIERYTVVQEVKQKELPLGLTYEEEKPTPIPPKKNTVVKKKRKKVEIRRTKDD